ncbi:basal body-orientation factor 1-like isoform X2 [Leucoraja erinacea]|uniref:basal body-orientation factor 1-like isoform X2 n=1 Tax=Leucoraja erinaceus TaxID=7782 RepID=UPI0024565D48|nr:basal body-orientation factor 1-like isoform X2 [Leucoraja erinacea]
MPKKTKGKGKKDAKSDPKLSTESDAEKAKANAALWESRLNAVEQSRVEYRNTAQMLARANESLMNDRSQVERDAMEVISYLKKQDTEKETKISHLQQQITEQRQHAIDENKKIIEIHTEQSEFMQNKMSQKAKEMQLIQRELNKVKVFRKKQVSLENELDDIKETMSTSNREHQETLRQLENKFFDEKIRLEREAEQRLNRLTEQAHTEAIINLDDRAQCVFKENVRLHETIKIYKMEEAQRRKDYKELEEKNTRVVSDKRKMLRAFTGKEDYPQIRTFGKNEYSTNCVYQDMEDAEHGIHAGKVSISDLTWEQKEKVLRLLFAKMNGWKTNRKLNNGSQVPSVSESVLSIKEREQISEQVENPIPTFITQTTIEPVANQINVVSDQQPSKQITLPEIILT